MRISDQDWRDLQAYPSSKIAAGKVTIDKTPIKGQPVKFTAKSMQRRINKLLLNSSWTQLEDAPLTGVERQAWKAYRAALRQLPQQFPDPSKVIWPKRPA